MYNLNGKVALVTGASGRRGLGHAIAVRLAMEGADVVVNDKSMVIPREAENVAGWKGLESVVQEIKVQGRRGLAITADITQSQQVNEMVEKATDAFGGIDILVNNAGIGGPGNSLVKDMDDREWQDILAVNLTGSFYCSRAVGRKMIAQGRGGTIVNIASISGKVGQLMAYGRGHAPYCASKFGVLGLSQCLALEFAPYKIRVNAVCPGSMRTDSMTDLIRGQAKLQGISEEASEDQYYGGFLRQIPLHRRGTVEECAAVVAFLCSNESSFVLGQSINVDGGFLMSH